MFVKPRVFDVDFEPSNGVFYAGQNVTGNVHLVTDTFIHQLTGKTCPILPQTKQNYPRSID